MITVLIKKIENIENDELDAIVSTLSDSAKKRLNKKRNQELFLSSVCALSLLTNEQRADIDYLGGGAPFFKTLDADISISHSKTYAVVAISDSKKSCVGVDIEDNIKSPSTRFLTENEQTALENGTPYTEIWTKKEALFKFLKSDSTPFILLDSTSPEKHGAQFSTYHIYGSTASICTPLGSQIDVKKLPK